jgi:hypothetical protein
MLGHRLPGHAPDVIRGRGWPGHARQLSVMEQRYHAVMEVMSGAPVAEVARWYGPA